MIAATRRLMNVDSSDSRALSWSSELSWLLEFPLRYESRSSDTAPTKYFITSGARRLFASASMSWADKRSSRIQRLLEHPRLYRADTQPMDTETPRLPPPTVMLLPHSPHTNHPPKRYGWALARLHPAIRRRVMRSLTILRRSCTRSQSSSETMRSPGTSTTTHCSGG